VDATKYIHRSKSWRAEFDAVLHADPEQLPPRYNVAPSLLVPVIRVRKGERELAALSWGLLPSWRKSTEGNRPINARAETLFDKPMFRNAIARRRCLIPAEQMRAYPVSTRVNNAKNDDAALIEPLV
jgi:putative SOS response-associated peptidase YedK